VLDRAIPDPKRDLDAPFLMPVENVYTISGIGTVVTGRVDRGVLKPGQSIEIVGLTEAGEPRKVVVTSIEAFRRPLTEAKAGENVGLRLRGVRHDEVARGQIMAAPGSIASHQAGSAELFVLTAAEGGRHTPFGTGYSAQFFFGTTDVTGTIDVGETLLNPGDRASISFRLHKPVGMQPGMRFAVREGGKTVGAGVVTKVD
jgi:elongation factor Tu